MMRKVTLITLSLITVGLMIVSVYALWWPLYWDSLSSTRFACAYLNGDEWAFRERFADDPVYLQDTASYYRRYGCYSRDDAAFGFGMWFVFSWRHSPATFPLPLVPASLRKASYISVPVWVPVLLFGAYPAIAFLLELGRRWRRYNRGRCLECGYNLTGNVSGVCPECGATI